MRYATYYAKLTKIKELVTEHGVEAFNAPDLLYKIVGDSQEYGDAARAKIALYLLQTFPGLASTLSNEQKNPLREATYMGNLLCTLVLLTYGANPLISYKRGDMARDAEWSAAGSGHVQTAQVVADWKAAMGVHLSSDEAIDAFAQKRAQKRVEERMAKRAERMAKKAERMAKRAERKRKREEKEEEEEEKEEEEEGVPPKKKGKKM